MQPHPGPSCPFLSQVVALFLLSLWTPLDVLRNGALACLSCILASIGMSQLPLPHQQFCPCCCLAARRVSEKGTLQLSIDTDSVRRLLLQFPKAARPLDDPSEFSSYAHHVEREMGGAINLVKVLQVRVCVCAVCVVCVVWQQEIHPARTVLELTH